MHFYKYIYELDFTSVELSKCNNNIASVEPINQEQRVLGNATFEPSRSVFNLTYSAPEQVSQLLKILIESFLSFKTVCCAHHLLF